MLTGKFHKLEDSNQLHDLEKLISPLMRKKVKTYREQELYKELLMKAKEFNTASIQVQDSICAIDNSPLIRHVSFNFTDTSEFVRVMHSFSDQRNWFQHAIAKWNNRRIELDEFAETFHTSGVSFVFNLQNDSEIYDFREGSDDFRYNYSNSRLKRPLKTGARVNDGLSVKLFDVPYPPSHKRKCLNNKLCIYSPYEGPSGCTFFSYGQDLTFKITPEIIQADESLRSIPPLERKCYFEGERKLKYFNH
jgi:hypothetical protein